MTPGHEPSDLDRRILAVLGGYDPARVWPKLRTIAERVQASPRHVRRRLAVLEELGYVRRLAVHERTDDAEWTRRGQASRGPGRQTSNSYRLAGRPPGHGARPDAGDVRGPPDMGYPQAAAQPPGHAETMSALERVSEASTVRLEGDPLDVGLQRESTGFDHPPSKGEVLDALERGLGRVEVLAPDGWDWAARYQAEPVGRCSRPGCCPGRKIQWPHTLGPDGQPWHAWCWAEPTRPVPKRRWRRGDAAE